jgi:hypothetical protein
MARGSNSSQGSSEVAGERAGSLARSWRIWRKMARSQPKNRLESHAGVGPGLRQEERQAGGWSTQYTGTSREHFGTRECDRSSSYRSKNQRLDWPQSQESPAGRSSPETYLTRRALASFGRTEHCSLPDTGRRPGLGSTLRDEKRALGFWRSGTEISRAKYWQGGSRCWCCGSSARSCYGWPSGRSPVDC